MSKLSKTYTRAIQITDNNGDEVFKFIGNPLCFQSHAGKTKLYAKLDLPYNISDWIIDVGSYQYKVIPDKEFIKQYKPEQKEA